MLEGTENTEDVYKSSREINVGKRSLQDRLQRMSGQPFPLEETFTILTQLGQALSYAHECEVIHGNLTPDNILFNDNGDVILADFFLQALATKPNDATTPEASTYRAPELFPGNASKQGDLYALGCIAYEMLTGHKPCLIPSVSKPGTFYHTKNPIPPKHFNPALSSRSEEAILKAIAKEPTQRHRDIRSFLAALGISVPIEAADTISLDALKPNTFADHISYPLDNDVLTDAIIANPSDNLCASIPTKPLSTDRTKRRWIGGVLASLIVVCIIVTSILALSTLRSSQGHKTTPTIINLSSPTSEQYVTPGPATPEATPTAGQSPTVAPSPAPTSTATVQPAPTPTPKPHKPPH